MRIKPSRLIALLISFAAGICVQVAWLSLSSTDNQYEPERAFATTAPDFNVSGPYYPIDQPFWMLGSIERFDIIPADYHHNVLYNSVSRRPVTLEGYFMAANSSYKTLSLSTGNGWISFSTESRWGISYQFTGEIAEGYFPIPMYSGYENGMTIRLKGRLTKKLLGWKIAEGEMSFTRGFGD